ncbi:MAG: thiol-disulfide isomerase [Acidobacteria bacterium]|nr:thiol-disulfide isomerase [Acidobacteriota bacterium]
MPLFTYQEARPWAKAIKQAVATRKMPPWFADPAHGKFSNDRSMTQAEIDTVVRWVDAGAPEGDRKLAMAPRTFVEGWNIPQPDMVVSMPRPFQVPASGKVDYQYVVVPLDLAEDKWIQMVEARPTARQVVHHVVVFLRPPESNWLRGEAEPGVPFVPPRTTPEGRPRQDIGGANNEILTIYTPGNVPDIWRPGLAKLVKKGTDLVFQMHYTVNGKAVEDRTQVGLVFAKEPPTERVLTLMPSNPRFAIPPGDPNYRIHAAMVFPNSAKVLSFFPHMHVRGKAFEYKLTPEGGQEQTLLKVNKYDFNWQLTYRAETPLAVERGTRLEVAGYFDNSANNPNNPDPTATVRFGEQSWEEMMIGFIDIAIDARHDRMSWFTRKPIPASGGGQ